MPATALADSSPLEPVATSSPEAPSPQASLPANAPVIALVRSRGDRAIALRLAAELDALGYRVVEITGPATLRPLVELAHTHDVDALLRPTPSRTGIELVVMLPAGLDAERPAGGWIEDVVSVGHRRHDDLLALRAVETLRARLLEVGLIEPPQVFEPPQIVEPVAPIIEPEAPPETNPEAVFWLEVAPSYGGNVPMGFGPRLQLALRAEPASAWSVSLLGNAALSPHEVRRGVGEARVTAHWLALAVDARMLRSSWAWDIGAGVGTVRLAVEGHAQDPYEGRSTRALTLLPFLRTAVHPDVSPRLRVRLEALAGWAMPRTVVGFVDQEARWGSPELQASLVVSTAVPGVTR